MLRIFGRSHRGRSFHRMARFGWSGSPIRYRDRGHRSDAISGDIEGSRGWNRYNCAGVINWLVVYFRIVARWWNDRDLSRRESESERDELRIVYYSLIFLAFFSLLFFFFIQNTPAIRINCHWFVQTVFFPPYRRLNRGGKDNFASFECRVIKNNWHGKCDDIAPGSRILNASGIVGPCSIFYVVTL